MPIPCIDYTLQQLVNAEDSTKRSDAVLMWEESLKSQFNFIAVAATLVAGVVGQSLGWPQASKAHWMVFVLWYGALFMSLWCVILAFHLNILLAAYDVNTDRIGALVNLVKPDEDANKPSPYNLWILQSPVALFSWAVISYMVGLGVLILRPLWTEAWSQDHWVSNSLNPSFHHVPLSALLQAPICCLRYKRRRGWEHLDYLISLTL